MPKIFKWLARQSRSLDNWLLLIAAINWVHIFSLSRGDCRGIAPPWYCYWTWYYAANRLLLSALCVRSRRIWLIVLGLLISLQVVAGQLFYYLNTDEFSQMATAAREYGTGSLRIFLSVVIENPLTQGFVAVLITIYATHQVLRSINTKRLYPWILWTSRAFAVFLFIGYLSNFISHAAAEKETARWLYHDVLKDSRLYGDVTDSDYLKESAGRFASIGAHVLKVESSKYHAMKPWAEVGPSNFAGPFLITTAYSVDTSDELRSTSGHCLIFDFFGYAKLIDKDSSLFVKAIPYLLPF